MSEVTKEACVCGIIMPISHSDDTHTEAHWEAVLEFISEAISRAGMTARPVWQNADFDVIQSRILQNLFENEIAICDISTRNPNVMLELGIRLTTKRPTLIIAEVGTKLPFDTGIINTEFYDSALRYGDISSFVEKLSEKLKVAYASYQAKTYRSYMENFVFETVRPSSVTVSLDEAVADRLEEMNLRIAKLDGRMASLQDATAQSEEWTSASRGLHPNAERVDQMLKGIVSNSINPHIVVGARVHHTKFGDGTVVEIDGRKAEVNFDVVGRKRVMDSFITLLG